MFVVLLFDCLFILTRFLNNGKSHQSNAAFFTPLSFFRLRRFFLHTYFFEKYLNFCCFLSVPHLFDNYAKIVDERCQNIMCKGTLPSLLVFNLAFELIV